MGKHTPEPRNYVLLPLWRAEHFKEDEDAALPNEFSVGGIVDQEYSEVLAES